MTPPPANPWTSERLDDAFRAIREDRDEARQEHREMAGKLDALRRDVFAKLDAQEHKTVEAAEAVRAEAKKERAENRRATLQLVGVLGASALAAAGGIIIALLTGGAGG